MIYPVISIVGGPGTGKSTVLKVLNQQPELTSAIFTSIDECRILAGNTYQGTDPFVIEANAWSMLTRIILDNQGKRPVFFESSGMGWRLRNLYDEIINLYIIELNCSEPKQLERLKNREQENVPFPYDTTREELIELIRNDPSRTRKDLILSTNVPPEQTAKKILTYYLKQVEEMQLSIFKEEDEIALLDPSKVTHDEYCRRLKESNCQRCYLATEGRQQIVIYRGNPKSPIVILGEAPGADEDLKGLPFVGRSGKLLDKLFEKAGYNTNNLYCTNICRCRPDNNTTPSPLAVEKCMPILIGELVCKDRVEPIKAIVTIGATALRGLLGKSIHSVTDEVGKWHQFTFNSRNVPVFALFHTAYILRNPKKEPIMMEHINKFKKEYILRCADTK